jgi:hypothetical protein
MIHDTDFNKIAIIDRSKMFIMLKTCFQKLVLCNYIMSNTIKETTKNVFKN